MTGCSRVTARCMHQELWLLHTIICTNGDKAESEAQQREPAALRRREVVGAIPGHDGDEVCGFNQ